MGNGLEKPVESIVLRRRSSTMVRVGVAEMNGWRLSMEDAHVIHMADKWGFFGIFDGHGGEDCAQFMARRLAEELAKEDRPPVDDVALQALAMRLDQEFLDMGVQSGSTATFVIIEHSGEHSRFSLRVGNVGDSRVLLGDLESCSICEGVGTDGALTTDHKPDHPDERLRIERCGGVVLDQQLPVRVQSPSRATSRGGDLSLSRAFGDPTFKANHASPLDEQIVIAVPEFQNTECNASNFVMLVCDGISEGAFPNAEVVHLAAVALKATSDPAEAAAAVCQRAFAVGSRDNLSCMIVLFGGGLVESDVIDFIPGPFTQPYNPRFRKAYKKIASHAKLSLEEAVQSRYDHATKKLADAKVANDQHAIDVLSNELEVFKGGPPAEFLVGSDTRLQWFKSWLDDSLVDSDQESFMHPATTSLAFSDESLPVFGCASILFSVLTCCHLFCLVLHISYNGLSSLGRFFLPVVIAGLVYDKALIALGGWIFPGGHFDRLQRRRLLRLSYPRFTVHVAFIPFLVVAVVEVGSEGGVEFVQGMVGDAFEIMSVPIACVGYWYFMRYHRLELKRPHPCATSRALSNQLLRGTIAAARSSSIAIRRDLRHDCIKLGAIVMMMVPVMSVCICSFVVGCGLLANAPSHAIATRGVVMVLGAFLELVTNGGLLEHFPEVVAGDSGQLSWRLEILANVGEVLFMLALVKAFGGTPHN